MRLSQHSDFALRVLIYLACVPADADPVRLEDIANSFGISANHVAKVVQKLAHEDFIVALRGRNGGLRLARPPGEISVGAVFRAMEPSFVLVPCFAGGEGCTISPSCGLKPILGEAQMAFLAVLDRYTLADAIGSRPQTASLLNITP